VIDHRNPEELLRSLGISAPGEIDVVALADVLGVEVRRQPLSGCEARILGTSERAIITVNSRSIPTRQRFSIAHELGHWRWHRGRALMCKPDDMEVGDRRRLSSATSERIADRYAAALLMPEYLVRPILSGLSYIEFSHVYSISQTFDTSFIASAIRLVELNLVPSLLVCHNIMGRKWFVRARDIPERWFPRRELGAESLALDLMHAGTDRRRPELVPAHAWFDRGDAYQYEIMEQSCRLPTGDVLSLLSITDEDMLEDL